MPPLHFFCHEELTLSNRYAVDAWLVPTLLKMPLPLLPRGQQQGGSEVIEVMLGNRQM